jgi:hypothetical protein
MKFEGFYNVKEDKNTYHSERLKRSVEALYSNKGLRFFVSL